MNLDELRSVQRAERQRDSLQHLRDSFYEDVAAYIAQLKDERQRAVDAASDPFASEDVRRLTDEIESANEVSTAVYERRVGKVVKHASFAAADIATDEEGMTAEERDLFEDLVQRIRENRATVMATLDGTEAASNASNAAVDDDPVADPVEAAQTADTPADTPADRVADEKETTQPSPAPTAADPTDDLLSDALGDDAESAQSSESSTTSPSTAPEQPASSAHTEERSRSATDDADRSAAEAAAATGNEPPLSESYSSDDARSDESPADDSETVVIGDTERTTLRITEDVGTIFGVDEREYDLAREDVVTLPTTNATPLLDNGAAERID